MQVKSTAQALHAPTVLDRLREAGKTLKSKLTAPTTSTPAKPATSTPSTALNDLATGTITTATI
jgi:hypothetical protein